MGFAPAPLVLAFDGVVFVPTALDHSGGTGEAFLELWSGEYVGAHALPLGQAFHLDFLDDSIKRSAQVGQHATVGLVACYLVKLVDTGDELLCQFATNT